MAERPILFSAPMVRAILSGAKTQTRRLVKPQPYFDNRSLLWWEWSRSAGSASIDPVGQPSDEWLKHCPHGAPGDVLWVKETHYIEPHPSDVGITREMIPHTWDRAVAAAGTVHYRADPLPEWKIDGRRWRPSIHMPRWASRLSLRIKSVRVERLQEISEFDAVAEGVTDWITGPTSPRSDYRALWESINGAGSWDANPWVWAIEFKRQ